MNIYLNYIDWGGFFLKNRINKYFIIRTDSKMYFSRNITYSMNHYVRDIEKSRHFRSFNDALMCIKKYNLKKCMILKEV